MVTILFAYLMTEFNQESGTLKLYNGYFIPSVQAGTIWAICKIARQPTSTFPSQGVSYIGTEAKLSDFAELPGSLS